MAASMRAGETSTSSWPPGCPKTAPSLPIVGRPHRERRLAQARARREHGQVAVGVEDDHRGRQPAAVGTDHRRAVDARHHVGVGDDRLGVGREPAPGEHPPARLAAHPHRRVDDPVDQVGGEGGGHRRACPCWGRGGAGRRPRGSWRRATCWRRSCSGPGARGAAASMARATRELRTCLEISPGTSASAGSSSHSTTSTPKAAGERPADVVGHAQAAEGQEAAQAEAHHLPQRRPQAGHQQEDADGHEQLDLGVGRVDQVEDPVGERRGHAPGPGSSRSTPRPGPAGRPGSRRRWRAPPHDDRHRRGRTGSQSWAPKLRHRGLVSGGTDRPSSAGLRRRGPRPAGARSV